MPDVERVGPLSFAQEEQIANIRWYPRMATDYDLVALYELDGDLRLDCLAAAVDDLVARHPALRTVIGTDGGELVQVVRPAGGPVLERVELATAVEALPTGLIAERLGTHDVLAGRALFRIRVYTSPETTVLSLMIHHLVYDGWSLGVLWRDLAQCYAARLAGRTPALPELGLTYMDFAEAQRKAWPALAEAALPFWRGVLDGYAGRINWPGAGDAAVRHDDRFWVMESRRFDVPEPIRTGLRQVCRETRSSLFTVLLCATAVGLGRATGRDDLLIGTDVSGRDEAARRDLVGFLVNTRFTRVRSAPGQTLVHHIRQARQTAAAAHEFRDAYSGQIEQSVGYPEVIKVNAHTGAGDGYDDLTLAAVRVRPVPVPTERRHWRDIGFFWQATAQAATASIRFRPARVPGHVVDRFLAETLAVLSDPWSEVVFG
jgi:hypothetical protein